MPNTAAHRVVKPVYPYQLARRPDFAAQLISADSTLDYQNRVKELWTGTDGANITLSGTAYSGPPGSYHTFASRCTNGYLYAVLIENPSAAEYQIGLYSYNSAVGTLSMVTFESSSTGSTVTFSSGTKYVQIIDSAWFHNNTCLLYGRNGGQTLIGGRSPSDKLYLRSNAYSPAFAIPAVDGTSAQALLTDGAGQLYWGAPWLDILTADRTYYVRTDGSDNNTGRLNTPSGAFLTIQKAVDVVSGLHLSSYQVTIQVGNGTYTGAVNLSNYVGTGPVTILGDATTPANVVISTTSNNCFTASSVHRTWSIRGVTMQTTTSGTCLSVSTGSVVQFDSVTFGASAGYHVYVDRGSIATVAGNYNVTGGAVAHWIASVQGQIYTSTRTVTITGTPAFTWWLSLTEGSVLYMYSNTFSGSATGTRYTVTTNSVAQTNGAGTTALPGNVAGSTATGGQYV